MPKRQNYESDDGFVEDAPQGKKHKTVEASGSKNIKTVNAEQQKDDDGNVFWEISKSRRVTISTFKNNTMVSIREYYEKDGKSLPGKKGVSLTAEQFSAVVELLPAIESELHKKGIAIPRPTYNAQVTKDAAAEADEHDAKSEEENEDEDEEDLPRKRTKTANNKADKVETKRNHEATDDEE